MKFKMTFLKLLLSNSIIYLTIVAIAYPMEREDSKINGIDEQSKIVRRNVLNNKSSNISGYIMPIHYNIELILFDNYLRSKCIITLYISNVTQYIRFYAPDSTSLIVSILMKNINTIYKTNSTNLIKNNIVELDFGDVLLHGMYDLYIVYDVSINTVIKSFGTPYIDENKEIEWLIATGIPAKRQQIFPLWDNPKLGITFDISILHYPRYKALSNMPIRETKWTKDKTMMCTFFHKTPSISIGSVSFLVSSFHQSILSENETIHSSIWFRSQSEPHLEFAKIVIISASVYMSKWNILKKETALEDSSVLFESKVDHVAIPDLQNEIEQTLGFIFYREAAITYNEELDPVAYKTIIARLIAHGMIQKYIGNLFKPTYLWSHTLNEGFNIWYRAYIMDKALPISRMMDLFVVQVQHELLYLNTYVVINSTVGYNIGYPEKYIQSSLSHIKGSIIWRMLEKIMPPHIFIQGFEEYMNNKLSNPKETTADHLWKAMKSKIIEFNFEYDFNIKGAINSWIMQSCPFVLNVTRNYSTNVVTISVQFCNKLDEKEYYIPISYTTESNPNFIITWTKMLLTPWVLKAFYLEKNQWIIFNLQQAGYYRVNYDIVNWRKIARYLNSEKYSKIHVLNRAQIINDAFHFAIEKKLEFSVFWELASYLTREKNYIAWYPMFKAFEFLSSIFPLLDFYPEFKDVLKFDFMKYFISSYWNLYDKSNINDYTKCLFQELAKWECIINKNPCEVKSEDHLMWHLANPEENIILPKWKKWTYCNGLKKANNDIWNKVFNDYIEGNDKILECLAYSKNSTIIINYLEIIANIKLYIKLDIKLLQILDHNLSNHLRGLMERAYALNANIFLSVIERHTKYMLTSLLNNYKSIRHGQVDDIVTLTVIINNAYSKEQLGEIKKFVKEELKSLIISTTDVDQKIETRRSEIEKQINYFRSLFSN